MITLLARGALTLATLDEVVTSTGVAYDFDSRQRRWVPSEHVAELGLDLSLVTFAHIKALGALAVWVCNLAPPTGMRVKVTPPANSRARTFLATAGFCRALASFKGATITVDAPQDLRQPRSPDLSDVVFPLTWMSDVHRDEAQLHAVLTQRIGNQRARLDVSSAESILDIILPELLENVVRHSETPDALVAAWARQVSAELEPRDYLPRERTYVGMNHGAVGSLHLFVADAGVGVAATLSRAPDLAELPPNELLEVAFDQFTSQFQRPTERGTRGLYRVVRISRRYNGLVTLASGFNYVANVPRPEYGSNDTRRSGVFDSAFPGTYVSVEVPVATRVDRQFRLNESGTPRAIVPVPVSALSIHENDLRGLLADQDPSAIVVLDISDLQPDRQAAVAFVERVAEFAHYRLVAVTMANMTDDLASTVADDVNQELLAQYGGNVSGVLESYEPIAVVGRNLQSFFWSGTAPVIAEALNAQEAHGDLHALLNGVSSVQTMDGATLDLKLSPAVLLASVEATTFELMTLYRTVPKDSRHILITRSLVPVRAYNDIFRLLTKHPIWHRLIAQHLITRLNIKYPQALKPELNLVFEGGIDSHFIKVLTDLVRTRARALLANVDVVSRHDVDAGRSLTLDRSQRTLIVTTAIGGGQTARELTALAIRQNLDILSIAALVDTREDPGSPIELWQTTIPVSYGIAEHLSLTGATDLEPQFVNSVTKRISRSTDAIRPKPFDQLTKRLPPESPPFVRLGHYAGNRDRHFTFYMSRRDLADSPSYDVLTATMATHLQAWASLHDGAYVTVAPAEPNWSDTPALELAKIIHANLQNATSARPRARIVDYVPRKPTDVVYIAWGAVTGESLMTVIEDLVARGTTRLLVLCAFSQLSAQLEQHFLSMQSVTGRKNCEVTIRFAFRLPIAAYPQPNCPLCIQASAPRRTPIPELAEEQARELERLAIRPATQASRLYNTDSIAAQYGEPVYGLVFGALSLRDSLATASTNDALAWRLQKNIESRLKEPGFVLAIATLLCYEPQWLRATPLSNNATRRRLASALIGVSTNKTQSTLAEQADVARIFIALRLVSKSHFAESLSTFLRFYRDDVQIFSLVIHLTLSILSRTYVDRTGLPRLIESELMVAAAMIRRSGVAGVRRALAIHALDEAQAKSLAQEIGDGANDIYWKRFADALDRAAAHPISVAFDDAVDLWGTGDLEACGRAWTEINRWLRTRLQPFVDRFRALLSYTTALNDSDYLDAIFAVKREDSDCYRVENALLNAAEEGRELTDQEKKLVDETGVKLGDLVLSDRPILAAALDDCAFSYGQLGLRLSRECKKYNLQLLSDHEELADLKLFLPDRFAESVIRIVTENVVHHAKEKKLRMYVELSSDGNQMVCVIHFENAATPPSASPGPRDTIREPGLDTLRTQARSLPGVEINSAFFPDEAPRAFEVMLAVSTVVV